jgi:uncharacterized protein YaaW (UPF0174 family)
MQNLLTKLEVADFEFLFEIIRGRVSLTSDKQIRAALDAFATAADSGRLSRLCEIVEREIRYLGSSDAAYVFRKITGRGSSPGVPFQEIIHDVYRKLKHDTPKGLFTDEELLENLVQVHTSMRMRKMPLEQQRALLETVGMSAGDIGTYLKSNASRFAIPALIQVAGVTATQRIVANAVIGTVTGYVGRQTAKNLVGQLAARFPVWAEWLGPIAWGITGLWTVYDIQGPAARKTVPLTLYIGLCMLRDGGLGRTDA